MPKVRIEGTEKLDRVAKALREVAEPASARSLRNKLRKEIRDIAKPIADEQKAAMVAALPKRGGLSGTVAAAGRFSARTGLSTARSTSITITDSWPGHSAKGLDSGSIRHPVFGHRKTWRTTKAPRGMAERVWLRNGGKARRRIVQMLDRIATEIAEETR